MFRHHLPVQYEINQLNICDHYVESNVDWSMKFTYLLLHISRSPRVYYCLASAVFNTQVTSLDAAPGCNRFFPLGFTAARTTAAAALEGGCGPG